MKLSKEIASLEPISSESDVLLVSMPFGQLLMPSIALGLLSSALRHRSITSQELYLTFRFAEKIGASFYSKIAAGAPINHDLAGEWLFSHALFPQSDEDVTGYVENVLHKTLQRHCKRIRRAGSLADNFIRELLEARRHVLPFLESSAADICTINPRIVGFTSVFQQHIASLAIAKLIKERRPSILIVFGGANCEGAMGRELLNQFPFVDAVVSGEGDRVFPNLAVEFLRTGHLIDSDGVFGRVAPSQPQVAEHETAVPLLDLDSLPVPDYDSYFVQLKEAKLDIEKRPRLLFETSRGCWWGEKKHCTFCGLNGSNMKFRSKSASSALQELEILVHRYPGNPVSVVDNILDIKYFKDFIPALASRSLDLQLFYEVKANLTKDQLLALKKAGISTIQPGIESLDDEVLRLMRKGVNAFQNIQLLKWCEELAVTPEWNVLWGFPHETPEAYARMRDIVPLLTHLPPPGAAAAIRLDRFSPNFNSSNALGFARVRPYLSYSYIYKLAEEAVHNIAYYFDFDYTVPQPLNYTRELEDAVLEWERVHEESALFYVDKGTELLIWDFRPIADQPLTVLRQEWRLLYLSADHARSGSALAELANASYPSVDDSETKAILRELSRRKLILSVMDCYLALAVALGSYQPNAHILAKLLATIECLSQNGDSHIVVDRFALG